MVVFRMFLAVFFSVATTAAPAEDWVVTLEENGLVVSTKDMPDTDLFAFRCSKTLTHPIGQLSEALLSDDPKIKKEFVMGLTKFDIWQRQTNGSHQDFRTYTAFNIPFPFSDRDMVVQNRVTVDQKKKVVEINSRSAVDKRYPLEDSVGVRFTISYSKITLEQLTANKTRVTMEMLGSMNGWVPDWLMNFINNQWAKTTINQLDDVVSRHTVNNNQFVSEILTSGQELPVR